MHCSLHAAEHYVVTCLACKQALREQQHTSWMLHQLLDCWHCTHCRARRYALGYGIERLHFSKYLGRRLTFLMPSWENYKKPTTLLKTRGRHTKFLKKFWDAVDKRKGASSNIGGSLCLQSQSLGMPDGLPKAFQDWQRKVSRCSYALEKCLELVASGSAGKVLYVSNDAICEAVKGYTTARYIYSNYMKTFSNCVKVASFASEQYHLATVNYLK